MIMVKMDRFPLFQQKTTCMHSQNCKIQEEKRHVRIVLIGRIMVSLCNSQGRRSMVPGVTRDRK